MYNLQGGIALPEGARVFVDNVSFTNAFSEEVTEENKWAYLKTFKPGSAVDIRDRLFSYSWQAGPRKNTMHGKVQIKQNLFMPILSRTHWKDGTTVLKFSDGSGYGKFTLSDNTTPWNLFA